MFEKAISGFNFFLPSFLIFLYSSKFIIFYYFLFFAGVADLMVGHTPFPLID